MIYVTGDCHGNFRRFQLECFPKQANMTKDDTVIIAGDFGGVWFGDRRDDETLDWLEVSTLFVPLYGSLKKPDISQGGRDATRKAK